MLILRSTGARFPLTLSRVLEPQTTVSETSNVHDLTERQRLSVRKQQPYFFRTFHFILPHVFVQHFVNLFLLICIFFL